MKRKQVGFTILATIVSIVLFGLSGCSNSSTGPSAGKIIAVGAENEYADVISQIGGKYVSVTGIMSNPATDPHTYEASTKNASVVSKATLVVQNGLGYDGFMDHLESASPNSKRVIINVAKSLGYPDNTSNPHLWYKPDTMPRVAALIAQKLEKQMPAHSSYFKNQLNKFDQSLGIWNHDLDTLKQTYVNTGVAVTEPVSDYLLQAANLNIKTPWAFQAAVMNGTDPSPQDVKIQQSLFSKKQVKVFLYNRQAVDDATTALLKLAKTNNIPVVGVYETMPPNYHYQKWMEAETNSVIQALKNGTSTESLK
ncbi:metal ABC transporter solute-binding protein, Zn/Mn family [Sporolactobacillus pectinivorans]|uniref:metal ABC transporter solute-binding protein, Zn/Mn family n=1 Tax=Sporolactobacillus pectinivorans TaxID=1591408 RepID=UPI001961F01D|nr:zinc ABC transporter substrate-binding protein [Sporolactobacillus pectinivorans]